MKSLSVGRLPVRFSMALAACVSATPAAFLAFMQNSGIICATRSACSDCCLPTTNMYVARQPPLSSLGEQPLSSDPRAAEAPAAATRPAVSWTGPQNERGAAAPVGRERRRAMAPIRASSDTSFTCVRKLPSGPTAEGYFYFLFCSQEAWGVAAGLYAARYCCQSSLRPGRALHTLAEPAIQHGKLAPAGRARAFRTWIQRQRGFIAL